MHVFIYLFIRLSGVLVAFLFWSPPSIVALGKWVFWPCFSGVSGGGAENDTREREGSNRPTINPPYLPPFEHDMQRKRKDRLTPLSNLHTQTQATPSPPPGSSRPSRSSTSSASPCSITPWSVVPHYVCIYIVIYFFLDHNGLYK